MDSTDQLAQSERPPAPRSAESGARTREIILGTAERLFAARGFDGVSMRQIGLEADHHVFERYRAIRKVEREYV